MFQESVFSVNFENKGGGGTKGTKLFVLFWLTGKNKVTQCSDTRKKYYSGRKMSGNNMITGQNKILSMGSFLVWPV